MRRPITPKKLRGQNGITAQTTILPRIALTMSRIRTETAEVAQDASACVPLRRWLIPPRQPAEEANEPGDRAGRRRPQHSDVGLDRAPGRGLRHPRLFGPGGRAEGAQRQSARSRRVRYQD